MATETRGEKSELKRKPNKETKTLFQLLRNVDDQLKLGQIMINQSLSVHTNINIHTIIPPDLFPMIPLVGHDQEATIINEVTEEVLPTQHTWLQ